MRPIVILAKLQIQQSVLPAAARYYGHIDPELRRVPGYEGVGLWQSTKNPLDFVGLYHYANLDAANAGLEVVAERPFLAESTSTHHTPADVKRIEIYGRHGRREPNAKIGDFLSVSVRLADPGYSERLMEELGRILEEISLIDGYLGSEYGRNSALHDEVVGLASWGTAAAFANSVPPGTIYEVDLYRRIV